MDYYIPLLADTTYHIVSRAMGNEKLFLHDENYRFFLARYQKYISPVADTLAFSILPNHFHFMVQIKPYTLLEELCKVKKPILITKENWQPDFIMQQFSNMLNSYTKSFNKMYNRKGALFMDYLRRVEIKSDGQFTSTVFYIHKNAVHHGLCKKIPDWKYCSYNAMLSNNPTYLLRQTVLDSFGGREKFIAYHNQHVVLKNNRGINFEGL